MFQAVIMKNRIRGTRLVAITLRGSRNSWESFFQKDSIAESTLSAYADVHANVEENGTVKRPADNARR